MSGVYEKMAAHVGAYVVGGQMIAYIDGKHIDLGRYVDGEFKATPAGLEMRERFEAGELAQVIAEAGEQNLNPFDHDGDGKSGGSKKGGRKKKEPEPAPPAPVEGTEVQEVEPGTGEATPEVPAEVPADDGVTSAELDNLLGD